MNGKSLGMGSGKNLKGVMAPRQLKVDDGGVAKEGEGR